MPLAKQVCEAVSIPVVVHGGAGNMQHVLDLTKGLSLSGIAIASLFNYECILHNRQLDGYDEGNIDFLKSNRALSTIQSLSIKELKSFLLDNNIACRENE